MAGCHEVTSSAGSSTELLALWEENPAPPAGSTIGVYVEIRDGAPAGTLTLSSREARVCETDASPPDAATPAADAGPPGCPFQVSLGTSGGAERFAVVIVPGPGTTPPLLSAVLAQGDHVVSSVFRRLSFYAPANDAGASADGPPSSPDGGGSPADAADGSSDGDSNRDAGAVDALTP